MFAIPKSSWSSLTSLIVAGCMLLQGCAMKNISRSVDPKYPVELQSNCQLAMIKAVGQGTTPGCSSGKTKLVDPVPPPTILTDDQRKDLRNQYINQTVIAINQSYRNYKDGYYVGQASFDTLSDFTVLILTGLTAVTGTSATKAALGAAAAGVTGAHTSVQKNFFENNARDTIFSVMDKLRQTQLDAISKSEQLSITQYSMADALRDLDLYYEMGTVLKAQTSIYSATIQPGNTGGSQTTAPTISTQPTSQIITTGDIATLSVAAAGATPVAYQWYRGSTGDSSNPVNGATNGTFTTSTSGSYWVRATNTAGHADSNTVTVTVNPSGAPAITTQPSNQVIPSGQTATLSVAATGNATLAYQWYQGTAGDMSNPINGATNNTFTTPTAGSYWVRVTNTAGHADSATASVSPTVNQTGTPAISTQPTNQIITTGGNATLSVAVTGAAPLAYQWYRGSAGDISNPIAGAINSTFATPTAGNYWVRVTNAAGHADSNTVAVTVNPSGAPAITTQPNNQVIPNGQTATLSVAATGAAPLAYQWYRGSAGDMSNPINGATNGTLTTSTSGSYWVRVSNNVGHADSASVSVTVNPPAPSANAAPAATTGNAMSEVVNSLTMSIQNQAHTAAH
jgi:hypothetical protein